MKLMIQISAGMTLFIVLAGLQALPVSEAGREQDPGETHQRKEKLSTYERSFKPSFYDTEVYLYKKDDSTHTFGQAIDNAAAAVPETLQGFRVQLIATNNYDEALSVRNDLITRFPDLWFYTIYEVPAYKIRVGDFISRAEAKTVMDTFKNEGFKTAWIVPDKIVRNQPPKPPIPVPIDSTTFFQEN